jgi:hypothetical protein
MLIVWIKRAYIKILIIKEHIYRTALGRAGESVEGAHECS